MNVAIKFDAAHVEIYRRQYYLTITGQHINNTRLAIYRASATIIWSRVAEMGDRVEADNEAHSRASMATGLVQRLQ